MAERLREAMLRAARRRRLHMPGHFGKTPPGGEGLPWAWDWTEVEGLDNLAAPDGVLRDLSRRTAQAFGAAEAWLSVQGATLPVLAGMLATTRGPGARVVADRLAHRSVLAAAVIGDLEVRWIPWVWDDAWQLPLPPSPAAWEAERSPRDLSVITIPTYEGLAHAPTGLIAAARGQGGAVMVDAAHGTHWGRAPGLPDHIMKAGPDLAAHGLHKTEPVLTQTGVLLARDGRFHERVAEWWRRLGTSSPSYPLLLSMERYVDERAAGAGGWDEFTERAEALWYAARRHGFRVLQAEWREAGGVADPAKLTMYGDGPTLGARIRHLGLEPEALGLRWITMVLGPPQDLTVDDWRHIFSALGPPPPPRAGVEAPPAPGPMRLRPAEADRRPWIAVPLSDAVGGVAARALVPYPPGIPAVMPGEQITREWAEWLTDQVRRGMRVEGLEEGRVCLVR
jgi:arginine/lysine/ornithine decarboxylase